MGFSVCAFKPYCYQWLMQIIKLYIYLTIFLNNSYIFVLTWKFSIYLKVEKVEKGLYSLYSCTYINYLNLCNIHIKKNVYKQCF